MHPEDYLLSDFYEKLNIATLKERTMNTRNCFVILQNRKESQYNDFIGKFYHFPKKYIKQLSQKGIEFVYYEPKKSGEGVYFGFGKIAKIFEDKKEPEHYFAEIVDYNPFSIEVPFLDDQENRRETGPGFNVQNSVRSIDQDLLDELCLDGGIILNIESDAHLIKVLGEQLIGSERVGILELVKNAIDAQASFCRVRLEKIDALEAVDEDQYGFSGYAGPVIVVEDDGIGMTQEVIRNGWLRPASPIKTRIKDRLRKERAIALEKGNLGAYDAVLKQIKKEHGGRIPLGEKGVGRFATHRLGRFLELRTKTKDVPYELVLKIDWDKFDNLTDKFVNLNSIGVSLCRENLQRDYGKNQSGTRLIIYGGREGFKWDAREIQDLNKAILSINSPQYKSKIIPFEGNAPTLVTLECPQLEAELPNFLPYQEATPNFTFDALIGGNGIVDEYELKFKHPEDKVPEDSWNGKNIDLRFDDNPKFWLEAGEIREPACGAFYIHLEIWYRKKEWIDIENWRDLTEYLDSFGGVAVYRDNVLMVDTKIGAEHDWLKINEAKIKQGFKISYRDFIGSIEIEQSRNFELIDKTNREGLIENQAFKDLSCLARNAVNQLVLLHYRAKRAEFEKLTKGVITDPKTLSKVAKTSATFFDNVSNSDYTLDSDPYGFFSNLWQTAEDRKGGLVNLKDSMRELQKSVKMIEATQELFVEQAGFGIAIAISLHEINKITSNFYHGIASLIKSGDFNKVKLEDLKETSASLQTELKRLGPLRAIRNEDPTEFNMVKLIKYVSEIYKLKMKAVGISFEIINPNDDFGLFGQCSRINQVFGNLFDNSIYWIDRSRNKDKRIIVQLDKKHRTVVFADSGTDVSEIIRPYLFQASYSLKTPPSGLGLYICKTYLNSLKGRIYETPSKDRINGLVGAHFTVDFIKSTDKRG